MREKRRVPENHCRNYGFWVIFDVLSSRRNLWKISLRLFQLWFFLVFRRIEYYRQMLYKFWTCVSILGFTECKLLCIDIQQNWYQWKRVTRVLVCHLQTTWYRFGWRISTNTISHRKFQRKKVSLQSDRWFDFLLRTFLSFVGFFPSKHEFI